MDMKNIIKISSLLAITAFLCFSCGKEYLDTTPNRYVEEDVVFTTTDSAQIAVNGLSRLMSIGYKNSGECGEPSIMLYYGNYPGNDFQKCNRTTMSYLINQTYHLNVDSSYDVYPWFYYYKLIFNANKILVNAAKANMKGPENEKMNIIAQALVFRAYSYYKLSEIYCHRWCDTYGTVAWEDSTGVIKTYTGFGADQGLPIRLRPTTGDLALSYLYQVRDQVYSDLDSAITLFEQCGIERRSEEYYKADIHVAHGVYTRAALCWEDWEKAAYHAPLAREGFPLMSNDEYVNSGFNKPNCEWIWSTYDAVDMNLGSQSFYSYMASNGTSINCVTYPSAISKELYDQIPREDVRKVMYLEPITNAEGWSEIDTLYYPTTGRSVGPLAVRAKEQYGDKLYIDNNGQLLSAIYIYMQFKFQSNNLPAVGNVVLMRAAEMYYAEAEALYNINMSAYKEKIQGLLNEVNAERNPSYKCTLNGDKLYDEILKYRRFDLWGEGFDWFDYKRWDKSIKRKGLANGGSFHSSFAREIAPGGANKWTWIIPRKETDYNKLIETIGGEPTPED